MIRFNILFTILFLAIINANASAVTDTIIIKSDNSSEKINADLDSLVNSWYVKLALQNNPGIFSNDTVGIQYADSVYINRLSKINSVIKLPYNSIIRNHIHVYTIRQRKQFSAVLGLMDYYFPMIEDVFDSYGLPAELKYMAVIESAINTNAVNRH